MVKDQDDNIIAHPVFLGLQNKMVLGTQTSVEHHNCSDHN